MGNNINQGAGQTPPRLKQDRRQTRGQNLTLEFLGRQRPASGEGLAGEGVSQKQKAQVAGSGLREKARKDRRTQRPQDGT